jgi:hypothetical protein
LRLEELHPTTATRITGRARVMGSRVASSIMAEPSVLPVVHLYVAALSPLVAILIGVA